MTFSPLTMHQDHAFPYLLRGYLLPNSDYNILLSYCIQIHTQHLRSFPYLSFRSIPWVALFAAQRAFVNRSLVVSMLVCVVSDCVRRRRWETAATEAHVLLSDERRMLLAAYGVGGRDGMVLNVMIISSTCRSCTVVPIG